MRQFASILALCIAAAILYGLIHDQITIRLCPEYFTVAHAKIIESDSLTLIALAWAVVATWWMGAALGLFLAVASRAGSEPRLGVRDVVRPVAVVLGVMACSALVAGVVGYVLASQDRIGLVGELAANVPAERHDRFMAAWWVHQASYTTGALGGIGVIVWTLVRRVQLSRKLNS